MNVAMATFPISSFQFQHRTGEGWSNKRTGPGEPSRSNEPTHSFELITSLYHTGSPARSLLLPVHRFRGDIQYPNEINRRKIRTSKSPGKKRAKRVPNRHFPAKKRLFRTHPRNR